MEFIHYGADGFDSRKFRATLDHSPRYDKPAGLWASPLEPEDGFDEVYSWKEWCEAEDFHTERLEKSFKFRLRPEARVLVIRSLKDAEPYILKGTASNTFDYRLDLNKIYAHFDAMLVWMSQSELHDFFLFYTWDVDSICVWNSGAIELLPSE